MPGPSGIDVLKELRRSHPTLPVIMVTVNTDVDVVQECLAGLATQAPRRTESA